MSLCVSVSLYLCVTPCISTCLCMSCVSVCLCVCMYLCVFLCVSMCLCRTKYVSVCLVYSVCLHASAYVLYVCCYFPSYFLLFFFLFGCSVRLLFEFFFFLFWDLPATSGGVTRIKKKQQPYLVLQNLFSHNENLASKIRTETKMSFLLFCFAQIHPFRDLISGSEAETRKRISFTVLKKVRSVLRLFNSQRAELRTLFFDAHFYFRLQRKPNFCCAQKIW